MSEAQFKPIKINPELFTISPRNIKNKTLKKSKSQDNSQPKKLKQELLAKIKNYRSNNKSEIVDTLPRNTYSVNKSDNIKLNPNLVMNPSLLKPVNKESDHIQNTTLTTKKTEVDPDDDFMQSINFLKELSSKNKKKQSNSQDDFPLTLSKDDTFIHDAKFPDIYSLTSVISTLQEISVEFFSVLFFHSLYVGNVLFFKQLYGGDILASCINVSSLLNVSGKSS